MSLATGVGNMVLGCGCAVAAGALAIKASDKWRLPMWATWLILIIGFVGLVSILAIIS